LFDRAGSEIDSASGTDAGVLREFGEHGSPPQNRVAHASATLSDSSIPKIAFGDFSRASSMRAQQYVNDQRPGLYGIPLLSTYHLSHTIRSKGINHGDFGETSSAQAGGFGLQGVSRQIAAYADEGQQRGRCTCGTPSGLSADIRIAPDRAH
jgi:hypothetical protein